MTAPLPRRRRRHRRQHAFQLRRPKSFVTGSLELDARQIAEDLGRPDGADYATAVILHELGHVMGLEHVDDPVQLMYPEIGAPDGLAAGDLFGLRELGRAQCRKDL